MNPKLELNIGELSLDGFSHIDAENLSAIIEMELTSMLQEKGIPANLLSDMSTRQLNFGAFNLTQNSGSHILGRQIAKSIYSGFNQSSAHLQSQKEVQIQAKTPPSSN